MNRKKFKDKFEQARNQFIQELIDGCNNCCEGSMCNVHGEIATQAILEPRSCPEFQEFLKTMNLVK